MIALLAAALVLAPQAPVAANEGYYMQPAIRGNRIVFVSQGDLWVVGAEGGLARSLTSHAAPASNPALSPDGRSVAFTGRYEGAGDVYVMPADGGLPTRLTYQGGQRVVGWTPSGKVLSSTAIRAGLPNDELDAIDPTTRTHSFVPLAQAFDGVYEPSGKTLFFTRFAFQGSHTKRYKGGTAQNIWKYTDGAAEAIPLTASYTGTSKSPMWWQNRVYFISDRDGTMNLWSMDESGHNLEQLTKHSGWDVQSASLDSGRIAYQLGADLWVYDIASGKDEKLNVRLAGDFDQTEPEWIKNPMAYLTAVEPSPDGDRVVLTARGQVFVAPVGPGRLVEVTRKSGVRYRDAMFAPDGKSLLAVSDESGETEWWRLPPNGVGVPEQLTHESKSLTMTGQVSPDGKLIAYADKNQDLYVYDIAAKKTTKVASGPYGEFGGLSWSPDSQWLAYVGQTVTYGRIWVYNPATGQKLPITSDRSESSSPAWSPDGKWLYFLSNRDLHSKVPSPWGNLQPEPYFDKQTKVYMVALTKGLRPPFQAPDELHPVKEEAKKETGVPKVTIDFDGVIDRQSEVPLPAGDYSQLTATADRLFLRSSDDGRVSLMAIDIKPKDATPITIESGITGYELSSDGKHLMVRKGPSLYVIPTSAGAGAALDKPVDLSGWSFEIDPREEWRQMYVEAWRLERDYFYDRNMASVDWNAMKAKYMPLVDRVRDRQELSNVLEQLISELSALHMFVYGGDNWGPRNSVAPGFLGGVFVRDPAAGGYRVTKIYETDPDYPGDRSPLSRPGVDMSVGDVVLSVNGVDALSAPTLGDLLRNQAGKQVLLHIKDGATGTVRDCIVEPENSGQDSDLRYSAWEFSRRKKVDEMSKGTIGYVHLRAMGSGDIDTWAKEFYPVFDRPGLIIDVRHNEGGNIDSWIIEKLLRKAWFYWQPRVGQPSWNMQWAYRGHVVVLCDEFTASDGEAFTEGIKRLGLGKVIGTRTWGGEIWLSSSNRLVDNGIATAAETAVYGTDSRWLIEGHGVDPDIVVDDLPHATYLGADAQLSAAVAYLQKENAEHPVVTPPVPKYPDHAIPPR